MHESRCRYWDLELMLISCDMKPKWLKLIEAKENTVIYSVCRRLQDVCHHSGRGRRARQSHRSATSHDRLLQLDANLVDSGCYCLRCCFDSWSPTLRFALVKTHCFVTLLCVSAGPKGVINDWRRFKLDSVDQTVPQNKRELLRQMSSPRDDDKERLNRKVNGNIWNNIIIVTTQRGMQA